MQTGHSSRFCTSLVDDVPRFPPKLVAVFLEGKALNSVLEVAVS